MKYDFDKIVPRKTTGCIKYDRRPDLDPYWVADMDFVSAPEILEALHQRVDHGVFGYAQAHTGVNETVLNYLKTRRNAEVSQDHIVHLGGLVPALSLSARAFCKAGDSLMTCTPVYPPFLGVHHDAKVDLITVDHIFENGDWYFDWEAMEKAVTPETKLFLLCNPQNPLGRVFSAEEVEKLARFCVKHDLILVSDEIHCDLIYDEAKTPHFSAVNLPAELQKNTITLLAPSKTWNIAGLAFAFAVIPDDSVRRKFTATRGHTLSEINVFAYYAGEAAYKHGEPWRLELVEYLKGNRDALVDFINNECEGLSIHKPAATYLAWIDARELGVENPSKFFEEKAGIWVQDGALFGWPGHVRFNFGCPRSVMMEGLNKMKAACAERVPASVH